MLDARRRACLDAMGIPLWVSRQDGAQAEAGQPPPPTGRAAPGPAAEPVVATRAQAPPPPVADAVAPPAVAGAAEPAGEDAAIAALDWDGLVLGVKTCRRCPALCDTRIQTVFGVGNRAADLMLIGEAPGADEDRQGEPFVGRAGKLLNAMLAAAGFKRNQVYIANILKCRPPGNRNPAVAEAQACRAYLERQIALVRPRLILSLGAVSAHNLLGNDDSVGSLRSRTLRHAASGTAVQVSYHPAYLLRRPEEKAKAWEDLQKVCRQLAAG